MDYIELAKALGLITAAHTGNHLSVANRTGAPASVHGVKESWNKYGTEYNVPRKENYQPEYEKVRKANESERQGAGFSGQDKMNEALNTPESNAANALYKAFYLATGGPKGLEYKDGDFGGMEVNSGNKYTKELVAATALWDALKSQNANALKNYDLSFDSTGGRPGLKLTIKMKDLPGEEALFGK